MKQDEPVWVMWRGMMAKQERGQQGQGGGFQSRLRETNKDIKKSTAVAWLLGTLFAFSLFSLLAIGAWPLTLSLLLGVGVGSVYEFAKQKMISSGNKLLTSKRLKKNKSKMAITVVSAVVVVGLAVGLGFIVGPALGVFAIPSTTSIITAIVSQGVVSVTASLFAGFVAARAWVSNVYERYKKNSISSWSLMNSEIAAIESTLHRQGVSEKKIQRQLKVIQQVIGYARRQAKKHRFGGVFRKFGQYRKHDYYKRVVQAAKEQNFAYLAQFVRHELTRQTDRRSPEFIQLWRMQDHFFGRKRLFPDLSKDSGFRSVGELDTGKGSHVKWWDSPVLKTTLFSLACIGAAVTTGIFFPVLAVSALCTMTVYKASQEVLRNGINVVVGDAYKKKKSAYRLASGFVFGMVGVAVMVANPIGTSLLAMVASVAVVSACMYIGSHCAKQMMRWRRLRHQGHSNPEKYRLSKQKNHEVEQEAQQLLLHESKSNVRESHAVDVRLVVRTAVSAIEKQFQQQLMSARHFGGLANPKSIFQYVMQSSNDRRKVKGWKRLYDGFRVHGLAYAQDTAVYITTLLQKEINQVLDGASKRKNVRGESSQFLVMEKVHEYFNGVSLQAKLDKDNVRVLLNIDRGLPKVEKMLDMCLQLHSYKRDTRAFIQLGRTSNDMSSVSVARRLSRERRRKIVKKLVTGSAVVAGAIAMPHVGVAALGVAAVKAKVAASSIALAKGALVGSGIMNTAFNGENTQKRKSHRKVKMSTLRQGIFSHSNPMVEKKPSQLKSSASPCLRAGRFSKRHI